MAVTARSNDPDGLKLDARIASLTAAVASTSSSLTKHALSILLQQAQIEAVMHYVEHNRINAATVLSTLS
jgi:hypothetical protein